VKNFLQACAIISALVLASPAQAQLGADQINTNGQYVLAAKAGNTARVGQLLRQGAAVNSRDRLGNSPLNMAAGKGNVALVEMLLAAGADPNLANLSDVTPLMSASFAANADIMKMLLAAGARIDAQDRVKKTAATYIAANGCIACMEALIGAGVDTNGVLDNELTVLMWAAGSGQESMVRYLLAHGADKTLKDNRGMTAAAIARDTKNVGLVELLE